MLNIARLKNIQTKKDLLTAFAGEFQSRNRYTYFAAKAKTRASSRSPSSSRKRPIRRRCTPSACSNFWRAARWRW
ncbi:hypothetical protein DFAR_3070006 [Desulfarculales bacterium]